MTTRRLAIATSLVSLGMAPSASAQTDVTLELGGSQIGPAVGSTTDDARFAIGGLRASAYAGSGSGIYASFLGGKVFGDSVGGSFVSGLVEATFQDQLSTRWTGSFDLRFLAFGVDDPFPYRTYAAELGPSVRYRAPQASLTVGVLAGIGQSRIELSRRADGPTRVFEDDHWRMGTQGELLVGSSSVQVGIAGSTHNSAGETYSSVGGRLVMGGSWGVLELRGDRWDTPLGWETTGGLSLALPVGAWSLRGFFGRSDPDPLTLAQPGSGSAGVLIGRSVYSTTRPIRGDSPFEVIAYSDVESRIRITLDAPDGAAEVQLLGDFSLWEPIPMRREGDRWIVELDVSPGTFHYGFLVDDEWYVPDDAPDVVPDEWGRLSATLVIEGAGR